MRPLSLFYRAAYLVGFKPWDSGVSPPELRAVVEGPAALPPGRALDLGCGTGTNAVYLAEHGWTVTAVDLVPKAVKAARRRARAAGVPVELVAGDVSRLREHGVGTGYSLLFDLGCYHGLPAHRRDAYAAGVTLAALPGASLLLYGFAPRQIPLLPLGATRAELEARFGGWELLSAERGTEPVETYWYRLRRRA